jgi:hypothetical protein
MSWRTVRHQPHAVVRRRRMRRSATGLIRNLISAPCWRKSRIIQPAKSMICCHGTWPRLFRHTLLKPPRHTHQVSTIKKSGHLMTHCAAPSRGTQRTLTIDAAVIDLDCGYRAMTKDPLNDETVQAGFEQMDREGSTEIVWTQFANPCGMFPPSDDASHRLSRESLRS